MKFMEKLLPEYRKEQKKKEEKEAKEKGYTKAEMEAIKEHKKAMREEGVFITKTLPERIEEKKREEEGLRSGAMTPMDEMVKFPDERIKEVQEKGYFVRYAKYNPSQYSLELMLNDTHFWQLGDMASNLGHFYMHQLNDTWWQYIVVSNLNVISFVENAYSLDIVDRFADVTGKAIRGIAGFSGTKLGKDGVWGNLFLFMIVLAGAWAAYMGIVKRAATQAGTGLIWTLVVTILSFFFFANAASVMRYLNDISSGISIEIASFVDFKKYERPNMTMGEEMGELNQRLGGDGRPLLKGATPYNERVPIPKEAYSFILADRMYDIMIYEPYLMLQYGMTSKSLEERDPPANPDDILKHKIFSSERQKEVEEEARNNGNHMMTTKGTFQRTQILALLTVTHTILQLCYYVISLAILFYQMLFVILGLLAPFALIMAVVPPWAHVAVNWFQKFIGAIMMKLILTIFLSLLLNISQVLYDTAPPEDFGYVWTIALQLMLVVGVIWKRKFLFDIMQAPVKSVQNFAAPNPNRPIQMARSVASRAMWLSRNRGSGTSRSGGSSSRGGSLPGGLRGSFFRGGSGGSGTSGSGGSSSRGGSSAGSSSGSFSREGSGGSGTSGSGGSSSRGGSSAGSSSGSFSREGSGGSGTSGSGGSSSRGGSSAGSSSGSSSGGGSGGSGTSGSGSSSSGSSNP